MRVVSVNVGLPHRVRWGGRDVETAAMKLPVSGRVRVGTTNLDGDGQADRRVHGGEQKAVYAYPLEHYDYWRDRLGSTPAPGAFGENLTVEGLPLEDELAIGDRLRIGTSVLVVTQPRVPCFKLGLRFGHPDLPKQFLASGRSGYYLRVESEGDVGAGDAVELLADHRAGVSVADVTRVYAQDRENVAALMRLTALRALPDDWRAYFERRLKTVLDH
jgi:MOSC domain-containing protein YiiM